MAVTSLRRKKIYHTRLNRRYRTHCNTDKQRLREKKEKGVNPCISHVREVILLPVGWEGRCAPSCVGVPENANDDVGVADEGDSCVPKPLAHSVLEPRSRRGHRGQQARKRAPSFHVGDHGDPRGRRKRQGWAEGRCVEVDYPCAILTAGNLSKCGPVAGDSLTPR